MWFDPDRQDALHNIRHLAQERDGERLLSSTCICFGRGVVPFFTLMTLGCIWWKNRRCLAGHIGQLCIASFLSSGLTKYGWEAHDGESFGRQELFDENMHISTEFVKRPCEVQAFAVPVQTHRLTEPASHRSFDGCGFSCRSWTLTSRRAARF
jgi:hypothetical protein